MDFYHINTKAYVRLDSNGIGIVCIAHQIVSPFPVFFDCFTVTSPQHDVRTRSAHLWIYYACMFMKCVVRRNKLFEYGNGLESNCHGTMKYLHFHMQRWIVFYILNKFDHFQLSSLGSQWDQLVCDWQRLMSQSTSMT